VLSAAGEFEGSSLSVMAWFQQLADERLTTGLPPNYIYDRVRGRTGR